MGCWDPRSIVRRAQSSCERTSFWTIDAIIASPEVTATRDAQAAHCLALHAYAVDNTYTVVRDGRKLL